MEMDTRAAYLTKDQFEAAALDAAGATFLGLEPTTDHRTLLFAFEDRDAALRLAKEYWAGRLQVSARAYSDSLRRLKDRVFSFNGNGGHSGSSYLPRR